MVWETHKEVLLQKSELPDEMQHYAVCKGKEDLQTINTILFLTYNLTFLNMYKGLSKV